MDTNPVSHAQVSDRLKNATMADLERLRQEIDVAIKAKRDQAIANLRSEFVARAAQIGCTVYQVMGLGVSTSKIGCPKGSKKAAKYSDGKGNTWSGCGHTPGWLKARIAAGAPIESFLIKKA